VTSLTVPLGVSPKSARHVLLPTKTLLLSPAVIFLTGTRQRLHFTSPHFLGRRRRRSRFFLAAMPLFPPNHAQGRGFTMLDRHSLALPKGPFDPGRPDLWTAAYFLPSFSGSVSSSPCFREQSVFFVFCVRLCSPASENFWRLPFWCSTFFLLSHLRLDGIIWTRPGLADSPSKEVTGSASC